MAKVASHITVLPAELTPTRSSHQLINDHIARLRGAGVPQKVISLSLGFGANYVSMLKGGEELPLTRVLAFATATRLSDAERRELLHTRLMEMHGNQGTICVEALAQWAEDLWSPVGDEATLLQMWRSATSPAPNLLFGILDDPTRAARIRAAIEEVVQAELNTIAEDAATD